MKNLVNAAIDTVNMPDDKGYFGEYGGSFVPPELQRVMDEVSAAYEKYSKDEAADLLEERRGKGDCVVSRAGYLDLFGGAWGCVLQGNGWAEVCVISEGEAGTGCSVVTWELRAEDLGRLSGE